MNQKKWKNNKEKKEAYELTHRSLSLYRRYNQQDLDKGKILSENLKDDNLSYALRQVFKEKGINDLSQKEYSYWRGLVRLALKEIKKENKLIKEIFDLEMESRLRKGAYKNEMFQKGVLGDDYDSQALDDQPEEVQKSFWKLR